MNKIFRLDFLPRNHHLALLLSRVVFGLVLCVVHGWGKVVHFGQMSQHFPDPLHIGSTPSLLFAILSDLVCALLIVIGLATRWAALVVAINTAVAFALVHHFALSGPGSGELALLYFIWAVGLFFTGPGKFSLDKA